MKIRILATYLILGIIGAGCASTPKINTTKLPDETRAEQVKDMKFGMFVCWSFSTFSGHEWTPTLDKDASYFKATGCDTDQWCQTAKAAGMNYILFLSKHHDGFCLWDTATTDKKVTNSPLGIDVLAKLRKSCDKYGIKLALYFSEGDWNWPGAVDGKGRKAGAGINPDMKKAQLKELLTNYGPIEFWWMDHAVGTGGLSHEETVDWVHKFQPNSFVGFPNGQPAGRIVLRERGRPGKIGDTSASFYGSREEQYKGYLAAEFTYPILPKHKGGAGWFYSLPKHDSLCHPADKLYNDYVGALKYENIFSIDVGPNYEGRLRDIDVKTLRQVGEMIKSGSSALQTESANGQARNREELPLGMVAIPVLKKKVGMSDEQIKKVRAVYKSFRPHAEEADATIHAANDKKAAHWAAQPLRKKIFDAVRAICTPEQKAKFNKYLEARRAKLNPISQSTHALEVKLEDYNHDTAPEMKVKSRKLVFKADPKGLDWAARGSLTKTKTGRWIATYTQATQHGRAVPPLPTRLVVVHT
ncbi:MAG: alpha-L-fucosidase, partial [Deltaproteobacteria bacterium]|nr:alpha-L-fucosidase [Deltaproteobacteria bacterium]